LRGHLQILSSIKVKLFDFLILHSKVIPTNLYLIELIRINEHLPFCLPKQSLYVLSLIGKILVFCGKRLFSTESLDGGCQTKRGVHHQLIAHHAINVDVNLLDVNFAVGDSVHFLHGFVFGGGYRIAVCFEASWLLATLLAACS
jgi:hypothetical protein